MIKYTSNLNRIVGIINSQATYSESEAYLLSRVYFKFNNDQNTHLKQLIVNTVEQTDVS